MTKAKLALLFIHLSLRLEFKRFPCLMNAIQQVSSEVSVLT